MQEQNVANVSATLSGTMNIQLSLLSPEGLVNITHDHLNELTGSSRNIKMLVDKVLAQVMALNSPDLSSVVQQLQTLQSEINSHDDKMVLYASNIMNTLTNLLHKIQILSNENAALNMRINKLQETVDELKTELNNVEKKLIKAEIELKDVKKELSEVKEELSEVKEELHKSRKIILLGELAYVIDEVATYYVFGPNHPIMSISKIKNASKEDDYLEDDQKKRWSEFCAFIKRKHWRIYDLINTTSPLRKLRYTIAHGSQNEKDKITKSNLKLWATELLNPSCLDGFNRLLELSSLFTKKDQPLMIRKDDIEQVIQ